MDKDLFDDLTASLKEAASIAKGRAFPSRSFKVKRQNAPELGTKPETADRPSGGTDTDF